MSRKNVFRALLLAMSSLFLVSNIDAQPRVSIPISQHQSSGGSHRAPSRTPIIIPFTAEIGGGTITFQSTTAYAGVSVEIYDNATNALVKTESYDVAANTSYNYVIQTKSGIKTKFAL